MIEIRADNTILMDGVFVSYVCPNPALVADIYTAMDMKNSDNLARLEDVLDDSPIVQVKKIDVKDPPRRKETCFKGVLSDLVSTCDRTTTWINATSGGRLPFWTMFELAPKGRIGPQGSKDWGFTPLTITMNKKKLDEQSTEEFKSLFIELCTTVQAFYGYCTENSIRAQWLLYLAQAAENVFERKQVPDFDMELPDIYWLNYFGPGYVDFWGEEKIAALKKAYPVTEDTHRGILVDATGEPVFADDAITRITAYDFKKSMYEILGYNTFMHETHQPGDRGENVPTLEYHRQYV